MNLSKAPHALEPGTRFMFIGTAVRGPLPLPTGATFTYAFRDGREHVFRILASHPNDTYECEVVE